MHFVPVFPDTTPLFGPLSPRGTLRPHKGGPGWATPCLTRPGLPPSLACPPTRSPGETAVVCCDLSAMHQQSGAAPTPPPRRQNVARGASSRLCPPKESKTKGGRRHPQARRKESPRAGEYPAGAPAGASGSGQAPSGGGRPPAEAGARRRLPSARPAPSSPALGGGGWRPVGRA